MSKLRREFRYVEENAVTMYHRPCGCPLTAYMPHGVRSYQRASFGEPHENDLTECKLCGAVWRTKEMVAFLAAPADKRGT